MKLSKKTQQQFVDHKSERGKIKERERREKEVEEEGEQREASKQRCL